MSPILSSQAQKGEALELDIPLHQEGTVASTEGHIVPGIVVGLPGTTLPPTEGKQLPAP